LKVLDTGYSILYAGFGCALKRAVHCYICRLLAVPFDRLRTGHVSHLANICVL